MAVMRVDPRREMEAAQRELRQLALQGTLDVAGAADPTPISDIAAALYSMWRGDLAGAGLSAVSAIPYIGDVFAKPAKAARAVAKAAAATKRLTAARRMLNTGANLASRGAAAASGLSGLEAAAGGLAGPGQAPAVAGGTGGGWLGQLGRAAIGGLSAAVPLAGLAGLVGNVVSGGPRDFASAVSVPGRAMLGMAAPVPYAATGFVESLMGAGGGGGAEMAQPQLPTAYPNGGRFVDGLMGPSGVSDFGFGRDWMYSPGGAEVGANPW